MRPSRGLQRWLPGADGGRYDGLAMAEIVKCPKCGSEGESTGRSCTKCSAYIPATAIAEAEARRSKLTLDYLKDIDASLKTIKHIAVWWLILSILSVLTGIFWFAMTH